MSKLEISKKPKFKKKIKISQKNVFKNQTETALKQFY
jgi:hypothetical protein